MKRFGKIKKGKAYARKSVNIKIERIYVANECTSSKKFVNLIF